MWASGERARFTYIEECLTFDDSRIIFPETDFRLEYRGGLKNGNIMHGLGTLTLKQVGKTFTGEWVDGTCASYKNEILGIEQGWIYMAEMKVEEEKRRLLEKKQRIYQEQN